MTPLKIWACSESRDERWKVEAVVLPGTYRVKIRGFVGKAVSGSPEICERFIYDLGNEMQMQMMTYFMFC